LIAKKYFMSGIHIKRFLNLSGFILLNFVILFSGPIGCSDMMGNSHNESNSGGGTSILNTTANTANRSSINASKTSVDFSGTWMGFKDDGTGTYSLVQSGSSLSGNGVFNEIGFGNGSYSITGTVASSIATIVITGTSSTCSQLNASGTFAISSTQSSINVSISGTDCSGIPLNSSFTSLKTSGATGNNASLSGTWKGFKGDSSATYTLGQSGSSITGNGTFSASELESGLFSLAGTVNGTSATVSVTGMSTNCSPLKALGTFTLNAANNALSVSLSGTDCNGNPLTSSFSSSKVS
jgi:hypothetical protein